MTASAYYLDSLVPSWLAQDSAYRAVLAQHLLDRMALNGFTPVAQPEFSEAPSQVTPPIGAVLLRVAVSVEEFDLDMSDEDWGGLRPSAGVPERYVRE